jgi:hypothetical protein
MPDNGNQPKVKQPPTPADVLRAIASEVDADSMPMDRLQVQMSSNYEFAYRVYHARGDEYTGGVITFDR